MKLYYSPGACSLSPHIVIRELGLDVDLEKTDMRAKKTESGADYFGVTPKGQVPALLLDDGQVLTEGPIIVQYLADKKPEVGLMPSAGSLDRYRVQEWLNHITSEIHKSYSPLFRPDTPEDYKTTVRGNLGNKYRLIDQHLKDKSYLLGDRFTVADAYLFAVTNWAGKTGVDLGSFPNVQAYQQRVAARPCVQDAMREEGLLN